MLAKYFLIGFRNFKRNKVYITINILGLGIAIACCIAGYFNWKFKESWDSNHQNAASIYRVEFRAASQGNIERYGVCPMPLAQQLKTNEPGTLSVVRYLPSNTTVKIGSELFNTDIAFADSAFFDLFSYELADGSFSNFKDKNKIFISKELAEKYFKTGNAVGKEITQINHNQTKVFTVGGVFEHQPMNSSFAFSAITLFSNANDFADDPNMRTTDWGAWNTTFLKIDDPKQVPVVESQLRQYVQPQNWSASNVKVKEYYLENFKGMAQRSMQEPIVKWQQLRYGIPQQAIIVPNVTAFLLLLLACFNFTNTSIAISSKRFKEIGVRKVMGADKSQLIFQFMGENLLLCFFALIAGLVFAEFLVPAYNSLWPFLKLSLDYAGNLEFMFFLAGLLVVTALIAGSYPAIYITNFAPVSILKDRIKLGSTNWFTRILLGLTFMISLHFGNATKVDDFLRSEWKKNFPDKTYDSQSIEVVRESSNRVNGNGVKIVGCLGFIAILMSVTGLYTLVSLNIIKKTKEVGIRKVLGASRFDIVRIINFEFFLILSAAAVSGSFAGYLLVDNVLGSLWKYYLSLQIGAVAICVLTMAAVASMILVFKTLKVSSLNPVKTLRSE